MRTVKDVKENSREIMASLETWMKVGESEYVVYINLTTNGDLVIIPEAPCEAVKRTVVHDVGKLINACTSAGLLEIMNNLANEDTMRERVLTVNYSN